VTGLSGGQREVALLLFGLPESEGFALAGGSALVALGVIDRPTRDIDAFFAAQAGGAPGDVGPLASALCSALADAGWTVEVVRRHQTFARLVAHNERDSVEVDLAVDSPSEFSLEFVGSIPCLAPQDLAARKVLAMLDRAEGRDFTDLWTLSRKHGKAETISWAKQLDAGVNNDQIARAFGHLDRLSDEELPCAPPDRDRVRQWFEKWRSQVSLPPSE
jgi:NAD(P)-dependent dehydrogenase (short-subunit alcohol dehydrogenase family)